MAADLSTRPAGVLARLTARSVRGRQPRVRRHWTDALAEHYRKRPVPGVDAEPADIAAAVTFLASTRAAKSSGDILNVDGGVTAAYRR